MGIQRERRLALAAITVLLRRARGGTLTERELDGLNEVLAEQLVRTASAHGIASLMAAACEDPLVAQHLDPDLVVFLQVLRDSNRTRNAALLVQLLGIAASLHATGVPVVVLKGGAGLIAPIFPDPADRLMTDLDILVPEGLIDAALAALKADGYGDDGQRYERSKKHAPALRHTAQPAVLEVHTALSVRSGNRVLPADDMIARALPTACPGLLVASPADRLCHLVMHAQIDNEFYDVRLVVLRDMIEAEALASHLTASDWIEVRRRFAAHDLQHMFDGFVANAGDVAGRPIAPFEESREARAWATATWQSLIEPDRHRRRYLWQVAQWYGARVWADPSLAPRLFGAAVSPQKLRGLVTRTRAILKSYQ